MDHFLGRKRDAATSGRFLGERQVLRRSPGHERVAAREQLPGIRGSSKIDRYFGSMATWTCLLSPGFSCTLLQPTRRLGGSLASAGSAA